jgi:uncharacterized NAD(P)/FAD-binding protein YdhS
VSEKQRFVRHLQTFWDVHRHRVPAEVWILLENLRDSEVLTVRSGRIKQVVSTDAGLRISFEQKPSGYPDMVVDRIVNCTGPDPSWLAADDPLVSSAVAAGLVQYDDLGQGVQVDRSCAIVQSGGTPSLSLFAIGALCRGSLWETTAIPEIRSQASSIAKAIAGL